MCSRLGNHRGVEKSEKDVTEKEKLSKSMLDKIVGMCCVIS